MRKKATFLVISFSFFCAGLWATPPPWEIAAEKARAPEVLIGDVLSVRTPPGASVRHRVARVRILRVTRSTSGLRPGEVIQVHFRMTDPSALGPKPIRLTEGSRYALFLKLQRKGPEGAALEVVSFGDGTIFLNQDPRIMMQQLTDLIQQTRKIPNLHPRARSELCELYERMRVSMAPTPKPGPRPGPRPGPGPGPGPGPRPSGPPPRPGTPRR